jgi:hypothetical protein
MVGFKKAESASILPGKSRKDQIWPYLNNFYLYTRGDLPMSRTPQLQYIYEEKGMPIPDWGYEFDDSTLNTILNNVDNWAKDEGIATWRVLIARINKELIDNGEKDNLLKFRENMKDMGLLMFDAIDLIAEEDWLGLDLDKEVEGVTDLVYPVVADTQYLDISSRGKVKMPLRDFLESWVIQSHLTGLSDYIITAGLLKSVDFKEEINKYFGSELDKTDPQQLFSLFYFGLIKAMLSGASYPDLDFEVDAVTPRKLLATGYGYLVDELEALQSAEEVEEPWLVRRDSFGHVIDQNQPEANIVDEYIKQKIALTGEIRDKLNGVNYYGEEVSLMDDFQAGLINSWVSAVFAKIREKNFNPVDQSWMKVYDLTKARQDVLGMIKYGSMLKEEINASFGKDLDLLDDESWGIHSRNLLNTYAHIAHKLKEKEFVDTEDEAVEQVKRLLPGRDLYNKILPAIQKLIPEDEDYFIGSNDKGRDALANFTSLIPDFLEFNKYYKINIGEESLDSLIQKRIDMVDLGLNNGLKDLMKQYMGVSGEEYDLGYEGWQAGAYTFWNKVLFAAVNNLGEADGVNYVKKQLEARIKLRKFLETETDIFVGRNKVERLQILNTFEQWVSPLLSNLDESIEHIKEVIKEKDINKDNLMEKLIDPDVLAELGESQYIFPRHPEQAVEWTSDGPIIEAGELAMGSDLYQIPGFVTASDLVDSNLNFNSAPITEPVDVSPIIW